MYSNTTYTAEASSITGRRSHFHYLIIDSDWNEGSVSFNAIQFNVFCFTRRVSRPILRAP